MRVVESIVQRWFKGLQRSQQPNDDIPDGDGTIRTRPAIHDLRLRMG